MVSYHQSVPEISTLECSAFIGKEHVVVVTRKGKEGFLYTQLCRKGNTGVYRLSMASKKDKCSGEECSLCSGTSVEDSMHIHKNGLLKASNIFIRSSHAYEV